MKNHFELFQMPVMFEIDTQQLDAAYREVQGRVHPDKFVTATDAEKRVAMQWATRANEAYQTLKNPLKRAMCLCEMNGVDLATESNTNMPTAFLMQQIEWREALDEARDTKNQSALEQLENELIQKRGDLLTQVTQHLNAAQYNDAGEQVRQLMFVEKFGDEVGRVFELLEA
jgi:molecular chaperone HscB